VALIGMVCVQMTSLCCIALVFLAPVSSSAAVVRLVDESGAVSNVGLVQIQSAGGDYGTVCGMDAAAANVVCRQLGYSFGSVATTPCGMYGGSQLCGAPGSPVAMQGLSCEGGELSVMDCKWSQPDTACASHVSDSIVYCGNAQGAALVTEGSARIVSYDGAPAFDGSGRLELYTAGAWAPVCRDGFAAGAASVACASMGFEGVAVPKADCHGFGGRDYCGDVSPRFSKVACVGNEDGLLQCPHEEGDDVFCAAQESVVVSCVGRGNAQGTLQV